MYFLKPKKTLQKGQLTNIDVDLVSLLFDDYKPANRKGAVVKCDNINYQFSRSSVKTKSDDEGRIYVTIIEPNVVDSQGDTADAMCIQAACERFSQKGMLSKNDINHNMQVVDDCFIAENYILKTEDKIYFPETKIGSWVQVIKFKNVECDLWKKVKAGKFNGVSLYGKAEDVSDTVDTVKAQILKIISELEMKKDNALKPAIEELKKQVTELENKVKNEDNENQIKAIEKGLNTLMIAINKAVNTQIPGEKTIEKANKEITFGTEKVLYKTENIELYKSLANIDSGTKMNVLTDELAQKFIDTVVDFSPEDVFTDITVTQLDKYQRIDKGVLSDLVLHNPKDGAVTGSSISEVDLECPTEILQGVLKLSQETVEFYRSSKGEAEFGAYIEEKLSQKIRKALKKLIFLGDRSSIDASLKGLDGVCKKMKGTPDYVSIIKDSKFAYSKHLTNCLKTFTDDALTLIEGFKIYCSPGTLLEIQDEIAKRPTALGDRFVINDEKVFFKGIEVKPRFLPADTFIIGISKHLILGYVADATVKLEHSGSEWVWRWYVRVRFGTQYISGGLVKLFDLKEAEVE